MPYVYRYLYPEADVVFYVGKTNAPDLSGVFSRVAAHRNEQKFKDRLPESYRVEYIELPSAADADIMETALIALWNPPLNESKTGWGATSLCLADVPTWAPLTESDRPRGKRNQKPRYGVAIEQEWVYRVLKSDVTGYQCSHCGNWCFLDGEPPVIFGSQFTRLPALANWWDGGLLCEACAEELYDLLSGYLSHGISIEKAKEATSNG